MHRESFGEVDGVQGQASATTVPFTDGGGGGNYPEPATTRCGGLPADGYPLFGLSSPWGVLALPGARAPQGDAVEPGLLRLRLSDRPLGDCAETFFADAECDQGGGDDLLCGWGVEVSLSPEELQRGTIELAQSAYSDFRAATGQPDDLRQTDPRGSLVLHQVTPDCVVGEFFDIAINPAAGTQSGGFVAEICQRQCVPAEGQGC